MHILAALGTWLGVMILGLALVFVVIIGLDNAGVDSGTLNVVSFIIGLPIGVVASLSAMAVYERLY